MSAYLERVVRNAERRLADQSNKEPIDLLDLYRRFVKREEYSLQLEHASGESGRLLTQKRSEFIGVLLKHLWTNAWETNRNTHSNAMPRMLLMAVGGFGRGELNPYSDIDIQFLYAPDGKHRPVQVEEIVQHISYMLWDIGFKIGAATRTMDEMIEHANADLRTKTSLLEVRFLCGDEGLFDEFTEAFYQQCVVAKEVEYLRWRLEDQKSRHAKASNTVFLQEPNIKSGCGGLRDYHNLRWVARVRRGFRTMQELVEAKVLTLSEAKQLDAAYDFLLRIRTELHYQQKRSGDILSLRLQGMVANGLRYPQRSILRRTEVLMREYYEHSSLLYTLGNAISDKLCASALPKPELAKREMPDEGREMDGFILEDGMLEPLEGSVFGVDSLRLVRVFVLAQHHNAVLSPSLKVRVRRRVYLIDRPYIYQQSIREMILAIFSRKGEVGRITRMMHEVGVLGRLFPEFRPLTCLVQHEFFHQYTADEHTLVCIEMIDRIVDATEVPFSKYRPLMQRVTRPHLLYLAMLLHDTGKSVNGKYHAQESATLAVKAARRLKLPPKDISVLVFLVDHHLTMSEVVRRRNLEDEKTIVEFARIVQTQERLDLLMLLTFSDVLGTGATRNYSDWKDLLLWQLYYRTTAALSGVQEFVEARSRARLEMQQQIIDQMSTELDHAEVMAHFDNLPPNYITSVPEELIRMHIRLVHDFLESQMNEEDPTLQPTIHWQNFPEQGYSEVTVVTWDRDRLFVRVTGSCAASNLTILNAHVYTRDDDIAIETLFVATEFLEAATDPRDRKQFEKFLFQAVGATTFDFSPVLTRKKRPRPSGLGPISTDETVVPVLISVDQNSSETHTLLDVQTADYPGLLHRIAGVIADFGLDISIARITTEKGAALDTFHLTTSEGKKVQDEGLLRELTTRLKAEILA